MGRAAQSQGNSAIQQNLFYSSRSGWDVFHWAPSQLTFAVLSDAFCANREQCVLCQRHRMRKPRATPWEPAKRKTKAPKGRNDRAFPSRPYRASAFDNAVSWGDAPGFRIVPPCGKSLRQHVPCRLNKTTPPSWTPLLSGPAWDWRNPAYHKSCMVEEIVLTIPANPCTPPAKSKKYCSRCIVVEVLCQWVTGFGVLHHKFMEFVHVIEE